MKVNDRKLTIITIIITYIFTRSLYKFTGFNYSLSEGINMRLVVDLGVWVVSYIVIYSIIIKIKNYKKENK